MHIKTITSLLLPLAVHASAVPQANTQPTTTITRIVTKIAPNTETTTLTCLEGPYTPPASMLKAETFASNTNSLVKIVTSTTTVTAPVATFVETEGIRFEIHYHEFDATNVTNGFNSNYFKFPKFLYGRRSMNTMAFRTTNEQLTLPPNDRFPTTFDALQVGLNFKGFFKANETGTYTFATDANKIDNWGFLWVGENAHEAYTDANTVYQAKRVTRPFVGGSYSLRMAKGDIIPIRYLWANGGGPGASDFTITTPSGITTTDGNGYFVQHCF